MSESDVMRKCYYYALPFKQTARQMDGHVIDNDTYTNTKGKKVLTEVNDEIRSKPSLR